MNVSYIVTMELPDAIDPATINDISLDIEDDLISNGYDIVSVAPWARPSLGIEPPGQMEDLGLF